MASSMRQMGELIEQRAALLVIDAAASTVIKNDTRRSIDNRSGYKERMLAGPSAEAHPVSLRAVVYLHEGAACSSAAVPEAMQKLHLAVAQ